MFGSSKQHRKLPYTTQTYGYLPGRRALLPGQ